MKLRKISEAFSVADQIEPRDISAIADAGFRTIICNRPDGESADQTEFADIESAASGAEICAQYIPVKPGEIDDSQIESFAAALESMPGPVLAYCRSGTRSVSLWALQAVKTKPKAEILAAAQAAGYDLTAVVR